MKIVFLYMILLTFYWLITDRFWQIKYNKGEICLKKFRLMTEFNKGGKQMLYEELMFDASLLLRFNIFKYLNQSTKKILAISQLSEDLDLNYLLFG